MLSGLGQAYDDEERVAAVSLNHICQDNRSRSENWTGVALDHGGSDDAALSDYDGLHAFSSSNSEVLFPSTNDHRLRNRGAAYKIHPAFMHSAPSADRFLPSAGRAAYTSELKLPPATCGSAFQPATISSSRVPPPSAHSRAKQRAPQILSWLFPKSKKKAKPPETTSPTAIERGNMPQLLTEWGALSLESLKKELAEAHAHRDAALREAADVRSSLGELATKLVSVEAYCSELKKALRQATNSPSVSRRSTRSVEASRELPMPVSHDVMVEGFLQIATEVRLSVKQLCKALIQQVNGEASDGLSDKLNLLLRPYQLALTGSIGIGKHCSKAVLYHLEAIMNQAMFQDFENPAFQRNGSPRCLDPAEDRRQSFAAFVALRNLSWNEVLRKGTRYYSEDFSRFCDRKMSGVVATLGWSQPWPEQLLQCFFVAAKCVWLLHLLTFSFGPPLTILRIEDGRAFDEMYMEDIVHDRQQVQSPCQVKIMVMPGFYVQDRVLKCRVLTTKSAS